MTKEYHPPTWIKMLGIAAMLVATPFTNLQAATINMSNLETALAEPDNYNAMSVALWAGFMTQVFEYNMPFIELSLDADDAVLNEFRMTIGDTNYNFSNEFKNQNRTNANLIPVTGEYALLGLSTPGINFSSSIQDGGDTLVLDFGPGGLQPGQTVRFQVDINADPGSSGTKMFEAYSNVFYKANGGPDNSGNSLITLDYATGLDANVLLPNYSMDASNMVSLSNPRPYGQMQMIDLQGDLDIPGIPEPTTALLALIAGTFGLTARRKIAC